MKTFGIHTTTHAELVLLSHSYNHKDRASTSVETDSFADECYVVARSSDSADSSTYVNLTVESVIWAYEHTRTRSFYWNDKRLLLKRLMRTTNLRIFQHAKHTKTLPVISCAILIVGERNLWIGAIGSFGVCISGNAMYSSQHLVSTDQLGASRSMPHYDTISRRFSPEETVIIVSPSDALETAETHRRLVIDVTNQEQFEAGVVSLGERILSSHEEDCTSVLCVRKHIKTTQVLQL